MPLTSRRFVLESKQGLLDLWRVHTEILDHHPASKADYSINLLHGKERSQEYPATFAELRDEYPLQYTIWEFPSEVHASDVDWVGM